MFMVISERRGSLIFVAVLLMLAFFLTVPVRADENPVVQNLSGLNSTQQPLICQKGSESCTIPTITINPVIDHYIGDSFLLHGTANMTPGEELLVDIRPVLA